MSGSQAAAIGLNAPLGAAMVSKNEAGFLVWAPFAGTVDVRVFGSGDTLFRLASVNGGYFYGTVGAINPGTRYKYRLNGDREYPDPSRGSSRTGFTELQKS